ncbi:MAG TPA: hypothetical protein VGU22_05120 [Methylomirabilota bacterium]|jgi:hypothetical protein|nr:hypothetical protein [Methylomirabilota bacterium]
MLSRGVLGIGLAAGLALSGCVMHGNPSEPLVGDEPGQRMTGTTARVEGSVVRVDAPQQVIVLDDGRMYQVAAANTVYVNGQPVVLTSVQPGTRVMINQPTVVEYRDGRYVAVAPVAAVVPAPGVRQTIYGRVTDVDRDGEIRVRTDRSSFELRLPSTAGITKGDAVQMDVTISPSGPAASPR